MTQALILVDFENQWLDKSSEYYVGNIDKLLTKTNQLIDYCRSKGYKLIFTRHVELDSDAEFAPNSKAVDIISKLHKQKSDILITKHKISPFYQTNLDQELKSIKSVIICGILTNLCVRSAIQDAYDRDLDITVIKDCCVAFDKPTQAFTFKDLKATREEIQFLNLNQFLK